MANMKNDQSKEKKEGVSNSSLEEFKKLIRKAVFLTNEEEKIFTAIPNETWARIFEKNFDGNFSYASRVIFKKFDEIKKIDSVNLNREHLKIAYLDEAAKWYNEALGKNMPILFVTDFDNDGSFAQSIINEFKEIDQGHSFVEYAQTMPENPTRGISKELVDHLLKMNGLRPDSEFLIVTADNGINSREEQEKIEKAFPKAKLIITDHHDPDPEMACKITDKTLIVNPHFEPTEFFKEYNISGASTVGVLLRKALLKRTPADELEQHQRVLDRVRVLSKASNLLDYVNTHPSDKPEEDYVVGTYIKLQPLLNINNSLSKIIVNGIPEEVVQELKQKVPTLNMERIREEGRNIRLQNKVAKALLRTYRQGTLSKLKAEDVERLFLEGISNIDFLEGVKDANPNYIEQLRPLIFGLHANEDKTAFFSALLSKMEGVFEAIKSSEKAIGEELRKGELVSKITSANSSITYMNDKSILKVFNRKFLNKVFNDANPGFALTLDHLEKSKVSGSFRSLYSIHDILKDKATLEQKLSIKIETPGHAKAAGFILTAKSPKTEITKEDLNLLNQAINKSIVQLKKEQNKVQEAQLLVDFETVLVIDKINKAIRGNVSNFENIAPIIKLDKDTVWTDAYTTKQYSMQELIDEKKFGYITVNMNFGGDTVIVPIPLVRKIVNQGFEDYLRLNYMDGGVFMAEKVIEKAEVKECVDLTLGSKKSQVIREMYEKAKGNPVVTLDEEMIKDNPFFKYHAYGDEAYAFFERMVLRIIEKFDVDMLSVFDVEANGFGNAKLMNFGVLNYKIKEKSGEVLSKKEFQEHYFALSSGLGYLLNDEQLSRVRKLSASEANKLGSKEKRDLLIQYDPNSALGAYQYFQLCDKNGAPVDLRKDGSLKKVSHYKDFGETVVMNQKIEAEQVAFLVKDPDFKVPQEMSNLTGITQDLLNDFGVSAKEVDAYLTKYYKGKKALFGAHNTPYDAKVSRANLPNFYDILKNNPIYDSALFSRELKLAYDNIQVARITKVEGISDKVLFNHDVSSDYNLLEWAKKPEFEFYPDRTNRYLLQKKDNQVYFIDKKLHVKTLTDKTPEEIADLISLSPMPDTSVKYSAQKLSEQWMTRALLMEGETFNLKYVDLKKGKYKALKNLGEDLQFFQDYFYFQRSPAENVGYFKYGVATHIQWTPTQSKALEEFANEFIELNREIHQKFVDAWMYKEVLTIKDPKRNEVTNDLVNLIEYQTGIPSVKVREVFEKSIAFKEKYKIDHVFQHETHVNGPYEGDLKGDILFEDKLTLGLLIDRLYDSYNKSSKDAVQLFSSYSNKAKLAFDMADLLSDEVANDAYSFRQALQYKRENISDNIAGMRSREKTLAESGEGSLIVKYKLGNDLLPQDTAVYALTREGAKIDREQIEKDREALQYVLAVCQIKNSLAQVTDPLVYDVFKDMLQACEQKALECKKELAKNYRYIEHNRKDSQLKKWVELGIKGLETVAREGDFESSIALLKLKKVPVYELDTESYNYAMNLIKGHANRVLGVGSEECVEQYMELLQEHFKALRDGAELTTLEEAVNKDDADFKNECDVFQSPSFLLITDIKRLDPVNNFMNKFADLRLLNAYLEEQEANSAKAKPQLSLFS